MIYKQMYSKLRNLSSTIIYRQQFKMYLVMNWPITIIYIPNCKYFKVQVMLNTMIKFNMQIKLI